MNWPFISRRTYEAAVRYRDSVISDVLTDLDNAIARIADLERGLDIANALRRDEQWRRIKAEGLCAYKDDRIKRVLGLPCFVEETEEDRKRDIAERLAAGLAYADTLKNDEEKKAG